MREGSDAGLSDAPLSSGEHEAATRDWAERLVAQARREGIGDLRRLLRQERPAVSVLHRCSWKPLAEHDEAKAIDAAIGAETRRLLLNTVTP